MRQVASNFHLIWVLTWLKFLPKSRRESAKLFWIFAEPAGQLTVLIILFSYIGRTPAYGTSIALFLLTGIVMLSFFSMGSNMVMGSMNQSSHRMRLGNVGIFHDALASMIFKIITGLGYTAVLMIGVHYFQGVSVVPRHPFRALEAFIMCGLLCLGMGMLRAYATKNLPLLERLYATLSRGLIFVSGVFFVPSFMAPQIREYLAYNPILHVIELFRLGVYDQYPTIVYSPMYLRLFVLFTIALGAALIWRQRASFTE